MFNVTVTGTSHWIAGSSDILRKTTVQFKNQDFTISLVATSIVANAGSPAHIKVTVDAVGSSGWAGTVTLTATPTSGLSVSPTTTTITGTGSFTFDITAASGGTYTLTVTGKSGSLSHTSQTLSVSVTEPAHNLIFGLDPMIFYSIVGVLVAVIVGSAAFALSRRGKKK
jgi:hypothetical protein